jgi:hypothetical protein
MSDNVTVSNSPTSINADIPVRTLDKGTTQTQVVAIDYGAGGSENLTVPDFATETTLQQIADSTTASTASISNVVATTSSTQILAANAERKLAIFVNDADQPCLVKFGETASSSSFTYKLLAGDILELPTPIYTGRIDAIWTNAVTGNMRVTEL